MLFADLCPHFSQPHSYLIYQVPLYDLNAMDSQFLGCPFSLRDTDLFWSCMVSEPITFYRLSFRNDPMFINSYQNTIFSHSGYFV